MKKKIVLIDTYYPEVIRSLGFDGKRDLEGNFLENLLKLKSHGFGTGGAYVDGLNLAGWDAQLLIPNSLGVQEIWRKEYKDEFLIRQGWKYGLHLARLPIIRNQLHLLPHMHKLLLDQIREIKPDVIMVQDLNLVPLAFAKQLKKHTNLLIGEIASPLPPKQYFVGYDLIVSALPSIVEQARLWGIESQYIPLGFNEKWANFTPASQREIDAIFVGSFSRHQPQTFPLLKAISDRIPGFQIYGPANSNDLSEHGLLRNYKGQAWGEEMFNLLGKSKIVVNRHGTVAGPFAVNMRMFESTGSGAALITENKSNLSTLFEPGIEVLGYDTPGQAADQVEHLLSNPSQLDQIARAGQLKTLHNHTYKQRSVQLTQIIENILKAN